MKVLFVHGRSSLRTQGSGLIAEVRLLLPVAGPQRGDLSRLGLFRQRLSQ